MPGKITITVGQLADAMRSGSLSRFFNLRKPVAVAWRNRGQVAACNEAYASYDQQRLALCERYGSLNPKTKQYDFTDEQRVLFDASYAELRSQPVDLPGEPVSAGDLDGTISEVELGEISPLIKP